MISGYVRNRTRRLEGKKSGTGGGNDVGIAPVTDPGGTVPRGGAERYEEREYKCEATGVSQERSSLKMFRSEGGEISKRDSDRRAMGKGLKGVMGENTEDKIRVERIITGAGAAGNERIPCDVCSCRAVPLPLLAR